MEPGQRAVSDWKSDRRKLEVGMQLGYSFTPLMVPGLGRISRENERTGNACKLIAVIHSYILVYSISRGYMKFGRSGRSGTNLAMVAANSVASSEDLRRLSG
jgi:hypothetical protein